METAADRIGVLQSGDSKDAECASRNLRRLADRDPNSLAGFRKDILKLAMTAGDLRVRWNLIIILGKLPCTPSQRAATVDWLFERLRDSSPLTRTFALQALMDLGKSDPALRLRAIPIAHEFAETGSAAMRARARKLLKQFTG